MKLYFDKLLLNFERELGFYWLKWERG